MVVLERRTDTTPGAVRTTTKGRGVWKWATTTDHKMIGNLYFITSMGFSCSVACWLSPSAPSWPTR